MSEFGQVGRECRGTCARQVAVQVGALLDGGEGLPVLAKVPEPGGAVVERGGQVRREQLGQSPRQVAVEVGPGLVGGREGFVALAEY